MTCNYFYNFFLLFFFFFLLFSLYFLSLFSFPIFFSFLFFLFFPFLPNRSFSVSVSPKQGTNSGIIKCQVLCFKETPIPCILLKKRLSISFKIITALWKNKATFFLSGHLGIIFILLFYFSISPFQIKANAWSKG